MATILAHITVKPGMSERFEQIARTLYSSTNETEPNVRRYEYWRGAEEGTYYTLLSFDGFNDFIHHQTSEHHETASAQLGEVLAGITLEWVDPIAGAAPLTPTTSEALPDDPTDLFRKYAQRFAAQIAPWWNDLA